MSASAHAPIVDMGEYTAYATGQRLVRVQPNEKTVTVTWDDDVHADLHWLWLRDNCACRACRHPQTRERLFELIRLQRPAQDARAAVTPEGALRVEWPENGGVHVSLFDPGWLRQHTEGMDTDEAPEPVLWTASLNGRLPTLRHEDLMGSGNGLRHWLNALVAYGCALTTDGPAAQGEVMRVADHVGWPRQTNFGRHFDVVSHPDPNNAAYTSLPLEPHVDLPNWERPPDFQLLYCLSNSAEGGASRLTDGFAVAETLRREDPEAFDTLASNPIEFRFQDEATDIRCRAPILELDADGRLKCIRFNNWIRGAVDLPVERLDGFYRAYTRFWRMLRDPAYMIRFSLQPGQMIAFDNLRVLHGRDAFMPGSGQRQLQGVYLDRDLVLSRLRVLSRSA